MAPTKQAKGDSVKEPKLHQRQNGERNLGRNQAQSGASSPLTNKRTVYDYDSGSITGQKSDWIGAFRIFVFTVGSGHVFSRPIQTSQWCLFIFFYFFLLFYFLFSPPFLSFTFRCTKERPSDCVGVCPGCH